MEQKDLLTSHGDDLEPEPGAIDLNCKEHVSDSEIDSQSEEEGLIENKVFPQQRFSPVQKPSMSADITYRPKPIKMKPESPLRADGTKGHLSDHLIPRPASSGSVFQPKGYAFKPRSPKIKSEMFGDGGSNGNDSRPSSVKSDTSVQVMQRAASLSSAESQQGMLQERSRSTSGVNIAASASEANSSGIQQIVMKTNQIKSIQNITMTTQDRNNIVLSSNMQMTLGKPNSKNGPIMGKMSHMPKSGKCSSKIIAHLQNQGSRSSQEVSLSNSQPLTQNTNQDTASRNLTNVTTTYKTITTPVPIASKPVVSQQAALPSPQNTILKQTSGLGVPQQGALLSPAPQGSAAMMKNVGILVQGNLGTSTSQYGGMALVSQGVNSSAANQVVFSTSASSAVNTGYLTTTLRNIAPPQSPGLVAAVPQSPAATNVRSSPQQVPAAVLTNFLFKAAPQGAQAVATAAVPGSATGALNIQQQSQQAQQPQQSPRTPTHVQYILPSLTVQTGPNGKVQNVLQMALPGTQVPQGNIQLTLPGQTLQAAAASAQVPGKIQIASPGLVKVGQPQTAKIVAQPQTQTVPIATNLGQLINQGGIAKAQPQSVSMMGSQLVSLAQPNVTLATQLQLTASGLTPVNIATTAQHQQQQSQQQQQMQQQQQGQLQVAQQVQQQIQQQQVQAQSIQQQLQQQPQNIQQLAQQQLQQHQQQQQQQQLQQQQLLQAQAQKIILPQAAK